MSDDRLRELTEHLDALKVLRDSFGIRAHDLLADLALLGLVDDLLESAEAAIALAPRSIRVVYPLARTAFEAAQRIVALATDDNYAATGVRAWLYYLRKDASVIRLGGEPERAVRWQGEKEALFRAAWKPYNADADRLLEEAAATLDGHHKQKRRADNFMGRDLAELLTERYPKLFGQSGQPAEINGLNRGIYAGLSRDSHARLRLEPKRLTVMADGTVEVELERPDVTERLRTVVTCLDQSVVEALAAVRYLQGHRKVRGPKQATWPQAGRTPDGYRPDLGLYLLNAGGGSMDFHFRAVPVTRLGVYPDGMLSWSANILLDDGEYIATFDAPEALRDQVPIALGVAPDQIPRRRDFWVFAAPGSSRVDVECRVGQVQANEKERFAPFAVSAISASSSPPAEVG